MTDLAAAMKSRPLTWERSKYNDGLWLGMFRFLVLYRIRKAWFSGKYVVKASLKHPDIPRKAKFQSFDDAKAWAEAHVQTWYIAR